MIEKSQFSTFPSTARGGLLICGMNWGGKSNASDYGVETVSRPWAPFFSHPDNYSPGFQAPLVKWFGLWGHPLMHKSPTHLDRAIAQSNVFFDQSSRFLEKPEKEQWVHGVTRLAEAVEELDFSGILLVSTTVVDWIVRLSASNHIPKWNQVVGKLEWDTPRYGRLTLQLGRHGGRPVAGVSHPSRGVAHADVQASAKEMRPWISEILLKHEMKNPTTMTNPTR